MITLKGKYNQANVFVDELEQATEQQIRNFLNHPAFQNTYIAIMPDCHAGVGSCIGFTMKMNEYIIPNIVGVDIGCGIDSYCLGRIDIDYQALHDFIKQNIPSGFHKRQRIDFSMGGSEGELEEVIRRTEQDDVDVYKKIGTLGGGNHFIEIDEDSEGRKWLTIHSGSRNFGNKVARYHQDIAKAFMKKTFQGDAYRQLEFLPLENGGYEYLHDMKLAQEYAERNRWAMAFLLITKFFDIHTTCRLDNIESVKSIHNYIDLDKKIVRKGAISAQEGENCIIPFNMRDGIAICKGKGNSKYNFSAPHGAGRLMSRTRAKAEIKLEDFEKTMKDSGVWSATVNQRTLDEAPMAYKSMNKILSLITETVEVGFLMKPVFNFKDATGGRKRRR